MVLPLPFRWRDIDLWTGDEVWGNLYLVKKPWGLKLELYSHLRSHMRKGEIKKTAIKDMRRFILGRVSKEIR